MLKWDCRYELGHERIDAEHRIFLGLIVDFQESALAGADKEKQIRILNEIVKYAEFHFVSEENIMTDYQYPDIEYHASLHNMLLAEMTDYYSRFCADNFTAAEMFEFLFSWFAFHTSTEDKKLVGYLGE